LPHFEQRKRLESPSSGIASPLVYTIVFMSSSVVVTVDLLDPPEFMPASIVKTSLAAASLIPCSIWFTRFVEY
jgi:hypothetical protein